MAKINVHLRDNCLHTENQPITLSCGICHLCMDHIHVIAFLVPFVMLQHCQMEEVLSWTVLRRVQTNTTELHWNDKI